MEDNNEREDGRRPVNITTTPLWKYVTITRDSVDGGGNKVWKCNFCSKKVIGSYYKVKGHLLHFSGRGTTTFTKVNNELKEEFNCEEKGAVLNKLTSKVDEQQRLEYLSLPLGFDLKQPKKRKGIAGSSIEKVFKAKDREDLDKQRARMFIFAALPFNFARNPYFRSYCTNLANSGLDGPIINIMGASSTSAVFIDSVDASGKRKDAAFVSEVFIKAIEEVGAENIVQCIWLKNLCTDVKQIQKFVTTHDMVKIIFTKHTKLQLLSVAETRFASHYVVAERMKEVKEGLEKMVMDSDFRVLFKTTKNSIHIKAREFKENILNDSWWDNLDYFLKFIEPIYEIIRVGDKDAPVLHLVYDMWDTMIETTKVHIFDHEGKDILTDTSDFFDAIHKVLESRWNKSSTPLHCLAHSLVSRFYSTRWLKGSTSGFSRVSPQ
ncbi:uncharacterized protein [Spinacia oleracea]|uniref:DUF659 domain-containing protein n=1 Tax=Spinacia oleracea TaxID=3562 RepID=A0ABM3RSY0_SPIOL|nr:uncharacterized protein LOC130472239 [Spinacia oleracea]